MTPQQVLDDWQHRAVEAMSGSPVGPPSVPGVTALAYFFWDDDRIHSRFFTIECAFLATRKWCGALPCILVVNRTTPRIVAFCEANQIAIQIDPTLTGGVPRMNIDCVETLHSRFQTDQVLLIQSDGFPLREGLSEFAGRYDYLGPPWGPPSWYTRLVFPHSRFSVGNGGFSLRSKRICEMSSHYYRKVFRLLPYGYWLADDVYYAKTMPRFVPACRKTLKYAPPDVAGRFAFESNRSYNPPEGTLPFGFHSAIGFRELLKDFGPQIADPASLDRQAADANSGAN